MTVNLNSVPESLSKVTSFVDILSNKRLQQPKKIAYQFLTYASQGVQYLSYEQLDKQAKAIAAKLLSLGLEGNRALLLYPPGLEFISAFFGCLYAGVIAVPAYPPRNNHYLSRLLAIAEDAQATIALTTVSLLSNFERPNESLNIPSLYWLATDSINPDLDACWQTPVINGDSLALLQYTSGSTGKPKGVKISHENLLHNCALIKESFQDTPNSTGVSWLPSYHDMGLVGGVLQPLYIGASMILMSPIDFLQSPVRWLKAISSNRVTTSGGPNFAYDLCVRKITPEQRSSLDLSCWEVAFTGAEPIRAATLDKFTEIFAECGFRREAFHPCYGMAEATLFVTGKQKNTLPKILTVDGKALTQNQVVICNQSDSLAIVSCGSVGESEKIIIVDAETETLCPPGKVGEIWVRSKSVASGYWQKLEETQATFQAKLRGTTKGSFLLTGDLGFLHLGELFVTGRLKDVIIIRGCNHYPQDIEATVEQCHQFIRKGGYCAAFSIEVDGDGEDKLVVVAEIERCHKNQLILSDRRQTNVEPEADAKTSQPLDVKSLIGDIRQAVVQQHGLQVHSVSLLKAGSIPKTSSGKIKRNACREGFLSNSLMVIK